MRDACQCLQPLWPLWACGRRRVWFESHLGRQGTSDARLPSSSFSPEVRNWPRFRDSRVSPFVPPPDLKSRLWAPTNFIGGRFSASPHRKAESVSASAQSTGPQVLRFEPCGKSDLYACQCSADDKIRTSLNSIVAQPRASYGHFGLTHPFSNNENPVRDAAPRLGRRE